MRPTTGKLLTAFILLFSATLAPCAAENVSGAGASFPFPIYAKWADAYQRIGGVRVNYQSIGSGGGIAQIKAGTVTFAGTDAPLQEPELDRLGLLQFPTVIGGVVPVVNLPSVSAEQLVLDGKTLAGIYMGRIKLWSDPAIKALNPGLPLPNKPISVVHRADASGTSFVFTTYLARVDTEWRKGVGAATSIDWPTGMGAKGNEGVAAHITTTFGSIGYVEFAYAKQNHLKYTRMVNKADKAVSPNADTFRAAASSVDWPAEASHGFDVVLVDEPGAGSWPMTATSYILVHKRPSDPRETMQALEFFNWAYAFGGEMALGLDYVPLPTAAVASVRQVWFGSFDASQLPDCKLSPPSPKCRN